MVQRTCFIHVPKCAGTSLDAAIRRSMGIWGLGIVSCKLDAAESMRQAKAQGIHVLAWREKLLIEKLASNRCFYLKGHYRCSSLARNQFDKKWNFVTVLRNPVDRWVSEYFYNLQKQSNHMKNDADLDTYMKSEFAIRNGASYIDFFTDAQHLNEQQGVDEAIENLEAFAIVGILEHMDAFKNAYKRHLGRELPAIERKNSNPLYGGETSFQVSDDQLEKIKLICKPDLAVYEHFNKKFAQ